MRQHMSKWELSSTSFHEGVVNRPNKLEMRKIIKSIERLEGEPQAIDI